MWSLLIDFGTSYTSAAAMDTSGATVMPIEGAPRMPSVACLDEDRSRLLVGRAAAARAPRFPDYAASPMSAMRMGDEVSLGGLTFPVVDLVAAVLAKVGREALRQRGGMPPSNVILTHPVAWGDRERRLLQDAARIAGLPPVDLIPDPSAPARRLADDRPVLAIPRSAAPAAGIGLLGPVLTRTAADEVAETRELIFPELALVGRDAPTGRPSSGRPITGPPITGPPITGPPEIAPSERPARNPSNHRTTPVAPPPVRPRAPRPRAFVVRLAVLLVTLTLGTGAAAVLAGRADHTATPPRPHTAALLPPTPGVSVAPPGAASLRPGQAAMSMPRATATPPTSTTKPIIRTPDTLLGTWHGHENQSNLPTQVPLVITLTTGQGTAVYGDPALCIDTLVLNATDGQTSATFTQTVDNPPCIHSMTVTLALTDENKIAYHAIGADATGVTVVGTGTLKRE